MTVLRNLIFTSAAPRGGSCMFGLSGIGYKAEQEVVLGKIKCSVFLSTKAV